jgi:hypothetical protein
MTAPSVTAHDSGGHGISTVHIQKHTTSPVHSCTETEHQIHKCTIFGDMMNNSFQQRERES